MEQMKIDVVSVVERDRTCTAIARALAPQAVIWLEVAFESRPNLTKRELWWKARDEVLRYLDVS